MINSMLVGAVGGAVGAAIGGLVAAGWRKVRKEEGRGSASVATAVAFGCGLIGANFATALTKPTLEERFDANPAIAALHQHFPAEYEKLMADIKAIGLSDPAAVEVKVMSTVTDVTSTHVGRLDDARARDTILLAIEEAKLLRDHDPASCLAFFDGKPLGVPLSSLMSDDLRRRDLAHTAAVLTQVATRPAEPPSPLPQDQAEQFVFAAAKKLSPEEQTAIRPVLIEGKQPATAAELRAQCNFTINMMVEAVNGPPGTARSFLAQS